MNNEVLIKIKDKRNMELQQKGRTDVFVVLVRNIRELKDEKVLEKKNEDQIYELVEIHEYPDKPSEYFSLYYMLRDGEPVAIASKNPINAQYGSEILPVENQSKDDKWEEKKGEAIKTIEDRDKELKAIAKEIGIDERDVYNLSEIELKQVVKENSKDEESNVKDEKNEKFSEKQINSINAKNEVELNANFDGRGKTLATELGLEEYESILIVHSYKINELKNKEGKNEKRENVEFDLIGKKKDGTYEKISDKIERDRGSNTDFFGINNPENVERENSDCMFRAVKNKSTKIVIQRKDPYGNVDAYIVKQNRENTGHIGYRLQNKNFDSSDSSISSMPLEVKKLFDGRDGINAYDEMFKEGQESQKDKINLNNVDGNKDTGKEEKYIVRGIDEHEAAIERVKQDGHVSEKGAIEELNKVFKQAEKNGKEITIDEAVKRAIENIEEQYHEKARKTNNNKGNKGN